MSPVALVDFVSIVPLPAWLEYTIGGWGMQHSYSVLQKLLDDWAGRLGWGSQVRGDGNRGEGLCFIVVLYDSGSYSWVSPTCHELGQSFPILVALWRHVESFSNNPRAQAAVTLKIPE